MCKGYELSFVIEKINGSLNLRPVITKCPEDPTPIIAATFLSLLFVSAFLLNMMVVVTVATSYTLKRFLFCRLLVSLCATCMVDCFLNTTIAIGYVTTAPWRFGVYLSYFNGFTINMLNSEMAFAVTLLTIDRIAAVKKYTQYLNMAKYKLGLIIGLTWLVSFVMALPLLVGVIQSMPYRNRYSCAVADPVDDVYLIIHVILVVYVSTLFMVGSVILTSCTFHRERKKQRVRGNQTIGYFDQILMTPYYRNEFHPAVFVACVVIGYGVCWLPFLTLSTIGPMFSKHWANETEEGPHGDDSYSVYDPRKRTGVRMTRAMFDEKQIQALNQTNNSTGVTTDMNNITLSSWQIPEIIGTPVYDTVFIWLRFIFDLLVPILVFIILKDVREKCEGLIMWCRPNSVSVASPKPVRPPYVNRLPSNDSSDQRENVSQAQKRQKNAKDSINFKTPILFATSEGLHIRTVEETYLDMLENKPLIGFARQNNEIPKFTYDLCDVMLGYEDLTDFDGQFHYDDDHETEKEFGAANPVVIAANRAAMGQKSVQGVAENDFEEVSIQGEFRPPTPPKVHIKGNDPAIEFGETIELQDDNHQKGKKSVRFAPKLTEEIPQSETDETSQLKSANCSHSADSTNSSGEMRKLKPTTDRYRQRLSPRAAARRTHRPAPKRLQGDPKKFSSRNPSQNFGIANNAIGTNMRNIKSRHMTKINKSLTSLEDKSPPPPARRFSKPSS